MQTNMSGSNIRQRSSNECTDLHGSMNMLKKERIHVIIETVFGTRITVSVYESDPVLLIKSRLQLYMDIAIEKQRLVYREQELKDAVALSEYSIKNGCIIKLILFMRGGPITSSRRSLFIDDEIIKSLFTIKSNIKEPANTPVIVIRDDNGPGILQLVSDDQSDGEDTDSDSDDCQSCDDDDGNISVKHHDKTCNGCEVLMNHATSIKITIHNINCDNIDHCDDHCDSHCDNIDHDISGSSTASSTGSADSEDDDTVDSSNEYDNVRATLIDSLIKSVSCDMSSIQKDNMSISDVIYSENSKISCRTRENRITMYKMNYLKEKLKNVSFKGVVVMKNYQQEHSDGVIKTKDESTIKVQILPSIMEPRKVLMDGTESTDKISVSKMSQNVSGRVSSLLVPIFSHDTNDSNETSNFDECLGSESYKLVQNMINKKVPFNNSPIKENSFTSDSFVKIWQRVVPMPTFVELHSKDLSLHSTSIETCENDDAALPSDDRSDEADRLKKNIYPNISMDEHGFTVTYLAGSRNVQFSIPQCRSVRTNEEENSGNNGRNFMNNLTSGKNNKSDNGVLKESLFDGIVTAAIREGIQSNNANCSNENEYSPGGNRLESQTGISSKNAHKITLHDLMASKSGKSSKAVIKKSKSKDGSGEEKRCSVESISLPPIRQSTSSSLMVLKGESDDSVNLQRKKSLKKRCSQCNKKLKISTTYTCHCKLLFCPSHRYSETHNCTYDYKTEGRKIIMKNNPLVVGEKLPKI